MYRSISAAKAFARDLNQKGDVTQLLPNPERIRQSGPFESIDQFIDSAFDQFGELLWLTTPEPNHDVLDYGCGHGRIAMAFSQFLDSSGSYYGFDIDESVIEANAARFSFLTNFQFHHEDIFSKRYNPDGGAFNALDTLDLGKKFDLIFLFSVFTHILAHDCDRLIGFLKRHMKPDAAFHSSWFLLNERAEAGIKAGTSHRKFPFTLDEARLDEEKIPEAAVAYDEAFVLERFRAAGFTDLRVVYGRWSGWENAKVWQDVIVARTP